MAPSPTSIDPKKVEGLFNTIKNAVAELTYLGVSQEAILKLVGDTILNKGGNVS